jgi:tRNA(fMet)-specific endonuclease VapC
MNDINYLLDTNICVYLIKQRPAEVVRKFLALQAGEVGVSSLTVAELQFGVQRSDHPGQNQRALERLLVAFQIANFDARAAEIYGTIRTYLEKRGTPIGAFDYLIAAHALSLDTILVTNNEREFSRVPGLKVENWV